MNKHSSTINWKLLLVGLFSLTQITLIGKLGISEFFMVAMFPFVFFKNLPLFRRDGVMPFFTLCILWLLGGIFADFYNHIPFPLAARGLAVPVVIIVSVAYMYPEIRRRPTDIKWLLLGLAMSHIISIFVFQRGGAGEMAAAGDTAGAIESIVGYKLFWSNLMTVWLTLPIQGWYMQIPFAYVAIVMPFLAVYSLLFAGGRSAFLIMGFSTLMLFLGKKKLKSMLSIKRNFIMIMVLLAVGGFAAKAAYEFAVENGMMGESEKDKYDLQTQGNKDILSLLMGGRSDFFIGVYTAMKAPIIGYGSHGNDKYGAMAEFLAKYGSQSDYEKVYNRQLTGRWLDVSAHSHIVSFWAFHGIFGLIFWVYILVLVYQTFRRRMHLIPELYGYLALFVPDMCWNIPFSPFGLRTPTCAGFIMALVLRAIERDQRFHRPMPGRMV